jgi:LysM repeat protein
MRGDEPLHHPSSLVTHPGTLFSRVRQRRGGSPALHLRKVITDHCFQSELRPMSSQTRKPDFSDVRSEVRAPAAKADFSDVRSEVSSTADAATNYTVVAGDTLSKIAKQFYADASAWKHIFAANRDQLSDPDKIKPGQILKIPPKS